MIDDNVKLWLLIRYLKIVFNVWGINVIISFY